MEQFYRISEVAKILHISMSSVYLLISQGKLKAIKVGSFRIRESNLNEYFNTKEQ